MFSRNVLLIFGLVLCVMLPERGSALAPRQVAPNFSLRGANGAVVNLSDFHGKVIYLDFWASWCGPCRHTLPWMRDLQAKFKSQGLQVLAVNLDKNRDDAEKALAAVGPALTVLFDSNGEVAKTFALPTMPTSFIIARDGTVVAVHPGFREGDDLALETDLQRVLAAK